MRVTHLGPDVVRVQGEAYDSAATLYLDAGEAVLVDALGSRADAVELRRFMESDLQARVRFVVATHYFSDHLAGLSLFPEAQIVAHRAHGHTFDDERHRSEEERGFYVPPTIVVEQGLVLRFGRFSLDIFHNPGHTLSTLNVDVPEADLVHVGDTVVGGIVYLAYTSPDLIREALVRLVRRGRHRILASHGAPADASVLESALFYLDTLERKVREAWRASKADEEIAAIPLADCLPPGAPLTEFEALFHGRNLCSAVERHLFDRAR